MKKVFAISCKVWELENKIAKIYQWNGGRVGLIEAIKNNTIERPNWK